MGKSGKLALTFFIAYIILMFYLFLSPLSVPGGIRNLDKAVHFGIFFVGGFALLFLIMSGIHRELAFLAGLVMFIAPVFFEGLQGFLTYRVYDKLDLGANYLGLLVPVAIYLVYLVMRKNPGTSVAFVFIYLLILIYTQFYNVFLNFFTAGLASFFNAWLFFVAGLFGLYIAVLERRRLMAAILMVSAAAIPFAMIFARHYTWRIRVTWQDVYTDLAGLFIIWVIFIPLKSYREKKSMADSDRSESSDHDQQDRQG